MFDTEPVQSWELERQRQASTGRKPVRAILNSLPAQVPEHNCHIPIRARIEWADTGEEWIDTIALGWSGGDLVYVRMSGTGHGIGATWLRADDVRRR